MPEVAVAEQQQSTTGNYSELPDKPYRNESQETSPIVDTKTTVSKSYRNFSKKFGARVKAIRSRNGWSQLRLARALNMSRGFVLRIEAGQRCPSFWAVCALAHVLGVSLSALGKGLYNDRTYDDRNGPYLEALEDAMSALTEGERDRLLDRLRIQEEKPKKPSNSRKMTPEECKVLEAWIERQKATSSSTRNPETPTPQTPQTPADPLSAPK
jgi:transcriptional regulator with XRE-family HTH domain